MRADGSFAHYPFAIDDRTTSWNRSFSFTETADGNIYAASQQGNLFRFDDKANRFVKVSLVNALFLYAVRLSAMEMYSGWELRKAFLKSNQRQVR